AIRLRCRYYWRPVGHRRDRHVSTRVRSRTTPPHFARTCSPHRAHRSESNSSDIGRSSESNQRARTRRPKSHGDVYNGAIAHFGHRADAGHWSTRPGRVTRHHCRGRNSMNESSLLSATNITKSYAGVQALKSGSLELRPGEVHALIGENGAGKSTLIKIITGAVQADSGEIQLNGQTITHNTPAVAKALGIAAIYQQPALFPELTVAENIAIGLEDAGLLGRVDWKERRRHAAELLAQVGAKIDTETAAGDLTMPQQQLVEIARALGAKAKVLILDEPTASLSEVDTQNLFRFICQLRDQGVGMVYI